MGNSKERNMLENCLAANKSKEWKLLNRANRISNSRKVNDENLSQKLLNALALCSIDLINIEASKDKRYATSSSLQKTNSY